MEIIRININKTENKKECRVFFKEFMYEKPFKYRKKYFPAESTDMDVLMDIANIDNLDVVESSLL